MYIYVYIYICISKTLVASHRRPLFLRRAFLADVASEVGFRGIHFWQASDCFRYFFAFCGFLAGGGEEPPDGGDGDKGWLRGLADQNTHTKKIC